MAQTETTSFQARVREWAVECFGPTAADDVTERKWRFLEEALELVQSLGGTASDAQEVAEYVFGRPIGEPGQEVGGVMVTLAALCAVRGIDMVTEGEREYRRITRPDAMERIRRKQATKPLGSPLSGDYPKVSQDS